MQCFPGTTHEFLPVVRHVTVLTSNDKFEAWGYTIITLQDSQGELSEFTSKF